MNIELTTFAKRQLDPKCKGVRVTMKEVDLLIELASKKGFLQEGYADFNKIISIQNLLEDGTYLLPHLKSLVINKIVAKKVGNTEFKTTYEARNQEELPVLLEWVEGIEPPVASWIQLIIYSKDQMKKEGEAIDNDWGIVGISTGMQKKIDPMKPATALRNALGTAEGGSGEKICRDYYQKCVDFWQENIMIRL